MPPDYLIVGAGVIGLTLARSLKMARPNAKIIVLEKESHVGVHASGRNSGIVHAGIYYAPGSLKAKLCVDGARHLIEYCREHRLPLRETGKVIIPTLPGDDERLLVLHKRALANGAAAELVDDRQLQKIEPAAAPVEHALFVPSTASIEPKAVLDHLLGELDALGVVVTFGVGVETIDAKAKTVRLSTGGSLSYGFLVNAAGAYSDRLAHGIGVGRHLRTLPFRGRYFEVSPDAGIKLARQIYPVPDPDLPFLGVHLTVACSGKIFVGPTARPALGREHYDMFRGIDWADLPSQVARHFTLLATNRSGFRRHALVEIRRAKRPLFLQEARRLLPALELRHLTRSAKCGMRAQLYDRDKKILEMDFVALDGPSSLHVLNAVSPGFTASFAFADYLVTRINGLETIR